jgi:hypothetical protein
MSLNPTSHFGDAFSSASVNWSISWIVP